MRIFGWFVAILLILGMFHVIDVHVCIAGKGQCDSLKKAETKNESTDLRNIPTSRQPSAR